MVGGKRPRWVRTCPRPDEISNWFTECKRLVNDNCLNRTCGVQNAARNHLASCPPLPPGISFLQGSLYLIMARFALASSLWIDREQPICHCRRPTSLPPLPDVNRSLHEATHDVNFGTHQQEISALCWTHVRNHGASLGRECMGSINGKGHL